MTIGDSSEYGAIIGVYSVHYQMDARVSERGGVRLCGCRDSFMQAMQTHSRTKVSTTKLSLEHIHKSSVAK